MTMQPARHECDASCLLQVEKLGNQLVAGNMRGTHVKRVASSFQTILRGSQLTLGTYESACILEKYFSRY